MQNAPILRLGLKPFGSKNRYVVPNLVRYGIDSELCHLQEFWIHPFIYFNIGVVIGHANDPSHDARESRSGVRGNDLGASGLN